MVKSSRSLLALISALCLALATGCGSDKTSGGAFAGDGPSSATSVSEDATDGESAAEDQVARLQGCIGRTAEEAMREAEDCGYRAQFADSYGEPLTDEVRGASEGDGVLASTVTEVEISEGGLLFGPSCTFKLDYVDAEAASERENDEAVKACKGLSALKALETAEDLGYVADFTDADGYGVSDIVRDARDGSPAGNATVTEAKVSTVLFTKVARFTIDYSDEEWLNSLVGRLAYEVCTEIEGMSSGRYDLELYPEEASAEAPTLDSMRGTDLVIMGARRGLTGLKLQVVSSAYRDMETALSGRLSSGAAREAAEYYAFEHYELTAWSDYAVAVDDSTWKITGRCSGDNEYSGYFKAIVTGVEDSPVVDSFDYGDWQYD